MQRKTLRLFWHFTKRYKFQRFMALFTPVVAVIVNAIFAPYILSEFINMLQKGSVSWETSWPLVASYAATIIIGEVVLWRIALYFTWSFEISGQRDLYVKILNTLAGESMSFHANRFGGALVSQSTKLVGAFERFWDMIIWDIIPMLSTVVGAVVVLLILGQWPYALFLIGYALVFAVTVFFGSRLVADRNLHEASMGNKMNGFLADVVTNVSTVKAFGKEHDEDRRSRETAAAWHQASTRLKWGVISTTSVFSLLYALAAVGAFVFAVFSSEQGVVSIGVIYLVFTYALNINRQLWNMNNITRNYNKLMGDAHEMTEILYKERDIVDRSTKKLAASQGRVEFAHVSFTHDNGEGEHVFNDFNLAIPSGQRVGIVGHSGSGKTTLTRILLRFSDIDDGAITIDGQDIAEVTQESLHEAISYVSQEPLLFHRSLSENIAYGKPTATSTEIRHAADLAHATEFIDNLAHGFDTLVGERGVKLSGGQRQRIAIARAILKDAPILVLDEATSALDSESEKLIQDSLGDLMKNRTSIVIAHRLSTIAKLDRIIVLDNGTIAEDGTHAELLAKKGIYSKLWSHQSGGFIEE